MLVLMPAAAVVLYADERAARVFTSVMGALIANVTTFFFCGTTLSFIDNTPIRTICARSAFSSASRRSGSR